MALDTLTTSNTFLDWLTRTNQLTILTNDLTDSEGPFYANSNVVIGNNKTLTVEGGIDLSVVYADTIVFNTDGSTLNSNSFISVLSSDIANANNEAANAYSLAYSANTEAYAAYDLAYSANSLAISANTLADSALTKATGAFTKANAAFDKANTASDGTQVVYDRANSAFTKANAGYDLATTANNLATSANSLASTANTTASNALPKAGGTMSGTIQMANNIIANAKTVSFNTFYSNTTTGNALVDFNLGQKQQLIVNGTSTLTFSYPGVGNYILVLKQGSNTVTLPAASSTWQYLNDTQAPSVANGKLNTGTYGGVLTILYTGSMNIASYSKIGAV